MLDPLSIPAQQKLAQLVCQAVAGAVRNDGFISDWELDQTLEEFSDLRQISGAFVTIYVNEELRGCLGEIETEDSLLMTVIRCARRVALADHRFEPLRLTELDKLKFKISILSEMELVVGHEEIEIGRDGLYARHGANGGLLLPDVPVEHGWDRKTFLHQLWRKACIPAHVPWEKVQLYRFTTQIIDSGLPFAMDSTPQ